MIEESSAVGAVVEGETDSLVPKFAMSRSTYAARGKRVAGVGRTSKRGRQTGPTR